MKKALSALLMVVILVSLVSCSASEIKPDSPLIMKLWLLDVGDNAECRNASRYMAWENHDENNNKTMVCFTSGRLQ